jgi:molybdopterin-biosynthesis enzyme MoeA-like protein
MGPTSDDHTRAAVAAALGVKLVHSAPAEAALRKRFKQISNKN